MISVRSYRTTYLCLKDDSYTGFYTNLSREEQSATHLTVLCSISYPQNYCNKMVKAAHHFSLLFVSPAVGRNGGFYEINYLSWRWRY